MTSPPTPNVRLTISVTPEVHAVFQRFAQAAGMSMSRAMGEWLGDTIEAAEYTAAKMEEARSAPRQVARELHAYALGLADETGAMVEQIREKARADRSAGVASPGLRGLNPPSGNTGGKGTKSTTGTRGGRG